MGKIFCKAILIFVISTISFTSSAQEVNPDTILQPGDKAPFVGILVNQDNYRAFTIAKREADNFHDNLDNYVQCPTEVPTVSILDAGGFELLVGIGLLGFIGGVLVAHH